MSIVYLDSLPIWIIQTRIYLYESQNLMQKSCAEVLFNNTMKSKFCCNSILQNHSIKNY